MVMPETDFSAALEPRKVFLGFLIQKLFEVEACLYGQAVLRSPSIKMLKGIIDSLDKGSQEKLKPQYDKLLEFEKTGIFQIEDIQQIYHKVTEYLHEGYLQDVFTATPRFTKSKPLRD